MEKQTLLQRLKNEFINENGSIIDIKNIKQLDDNSYEFHLVTQREEDEMPVTSIHKIIR